MAGTRGRALTPADHAAAHDRLESRLSDRIDETIRQLEHRRAATDELIMKTLGSIQADLRKGQMDRTQLSSSLSELEIQFGENRDVTNMMRERLEELEKTSTQNAAATVVAVAPTIAAAAKRAPGFIWSDMSSVQKAVAICAGVVAILAGLSGAMTGLERIVSGISHGAKAAWEQTRGPSKG